MSIEEKARHTFTTGGSADKEVLRKDFELEYLVNQKGFSMIFRKLYQEHMSIEQVSRHDHTQTGSPDLENFPKIHQEENLENETENLAQIPKHASRANEYPEGDMTSVSSDTKALRNNVSLEYLESQGVSP